MRICIVGTGYVGLVSAACFAEMGNDVRCVDVNPEVVALLDSGRIHIFEPGLEDLVSRNRQEGRLRFTTSLADGLDDAEFAFITVGTPSRPDGSCDLSFVEGVARQIGEHMRGPLIVVDKSTVPVGTADRVRELVAAARELAKEYKAYVIKIDPDVPVENEDFRRMLDDFGFRTRHGGKNFEAIQPKFVFRLWLNGRTEDELMASFHQKWRYNIRLAVKKGVEVRVCGKEMVPDFARIMLTTGVRDGFVTRPPEYFANMLDNLGEHARLYMAFHEGQPIAGTLAIHYGDKVWYLYGASSNEHRNLMPNYLLQWSMIQWAVETGCSVYDFRGVSGDISEDNPLYGLYKFKKGFGGDFTEFVGEYDLVLKRTAWLIAEKGSVLYKNLNAKLYLLKNRKK